MKDFKLVHAYFVNKKLKELLEEDFINNWKIFLYNVQSIADGDTI